VLQVTRIPTAGGARGYPTSTAAQADRIAEARSVELKHPLDGPSDADARHIDLPSDPCVYSGYSGVWVLSNTTGDSCTDQFSAIRGVVLVIGVVAAATLLSYFNRASFAQSLMRTST
jgi:hypothetical protein